MLASQKVLLKPWQNVGEKKNNMRDSQKQPIRATQKDKKLTAF